MTQVYCRLLLPFRVMTQYLLSIFWRGTISTGQIIATSHDLTPNGGLVREIPLFQGNLGWWNIISFGQISSCLEQQFEVHTFKRIRPESQGQFKPTRGWIFWETWKSHQTTSVTPCHFCVERKSPLNETMNSFLNSKSNGPPWHLWLQNTYRWPLGDPPGRRFRRIFPPVWTFTAFPRWKAFPKACVRTYAPRMRAMVGGWYSHQGNDNRGFSTTISWISFCGDIMSPRYRTWTLGWKNGIKWESKLPLFPYNRGWSSTQVRRGLYTHYKDSY